MAQMIQREKIKNEGKNNKKSWKSRKNFGMILAFINRQEAQKTAIKQKAKRKEVQKRAIRQKAKTKQEV